MMKNFISEEMFAYVDETGSLNDNDPQSDFYVCTAIFVRESQREKLKTDLLKIRNELGNGAVLKSSNVGKRHELRLKYLERLVTLDFRYVFLVTDKRKIDKNSALQYKRTRYKFIHRIFNAMLAKITGDLNVVIDTHGTKDFQESCLKYFDNHNKDLFTGELKTSYADDMQEPLLQIADFIGGSLVYFFDPKRKNEYSKRIRDILKSKEDDYDIFPYAQFDITDSPKVNEGLEELLALKLYNKAACFLDKTDGSADEKIQMQNHTLRRLFLASKFEEDSKRYIFSDELIRELKELDYTIGKRNFTVDIIGGLRRAGIIISGSLNGYKLALSLKDIDEYLEHDKTIIIPMLDKLRSARANVHTLISYDILSGEYSDLGPLVDVLKERKLLEYTEEPDIENIKLVEDNTNETP